MGREGQFVAACGTRRRTTKINRLCAVGACLLWMGVALPAQAQEASEQRTGSAQPSDEAVAEARLHFQNGVELLQAQTPNYQDAYRQFSLAYSKSGGNWKILGNLAFSALKLERDGEALEYYQRYLEQGGDEIEASERADIERELLLIRGNMATLELDSAQGRPLRVTIRREGSSAPPQLYEVEGAEDLGVRAGTLVVTASAEGVTRTWEVVVSPNETVSHTFDFSEQAEGAAATQEGKVSPPNPAPAEPSHGSSALKTAGYVTAGVGVAGLVGGIVTGVMKGSSESEARDVDCIDNVCREGAFDEAQSLATMTNILFIAGGVLTASGVTLVIIGSRSPASDDPRAEQAQSPRLELTPVAGPGAAGLMARGTF